MKSRMVFRVLGLSALATIAGATLVLSAPKAGAHTVVAVGLAPGYYALYYPPCPYYPPYPAYYAPVPYYPAPVFPFVRSVGVFFGPYGYPHYYGYGHSYYHR